MNRNDTVGEFSPEFNSPRARAARAQPSVGTVVEPPPTVLDLQPLRASSDDASQPGGHEAVVEAISESPQMELALNQSPVVPFPRNLADTPDNDAGNAELYVALHSDRVRHIPKRQKWIVYSNGWEEDDAGLVCHLAVEFSKNLLRQASDIQNEHDRKSLVKRALTMGDSSKIKAMLALASVNPVILIKPEDLNLDPWALGAPNGIIDLRDGQLSAFQPSRLITKRVGVEIDPLATCPRWCRFIGEVLRDDQELMRFVQKAVGYSMTGQTSEQVFFFLFGSGRNGKSLLIKMLLMAMGDYGCSTAPEVVAVGKNDTPMHHLADLCGARFVALPETEEGQRLAESRLKGLVGGDQITVCRKYEHPFEFNPVLKLWIHGNHKPRIKGEDEGIWRRVRLIPFTRNFTDQDDDRNLETTLIAELPGIFNWMLEGCLLWQREGLGSPRLVTEAVQQYRSDEDILGQFIEETVEAQPGSHVSVAGLYARYTAWAEIQGLRQPLTQNKFNRRILDRGVSPRHGTREGTRAWFDIRYKSSDSSLTA